MTRKTAGSAVVLALAGLLLCWQARAQEEPTAPGSDVPAAEAAPAAPEPEGEAVEEPVIAMEYEEPDEATAAGEATAGAEATLVADVPAAKPSPWRNSYFLYENAVSAYSFNQEAELTYNPEYVMGYAFSLRYYPFKSMYLSLGWSLEQELTNSDVTTKKHEVYWSDVTLAWAWGGVATIPGIDVSFTPRFQFTLPASKQSQARTLYVAISPGFDLTRDFEVLGGLRLMYAFRYSKYFNKYSGAVSEDPLFECPGNQASCPYYGLGPRNPSHVVTNRFLLSLYFTNSVYFNMLVDIYSTILYPNAATEVDVLGGSYEVETASGNTNYRGSIGYVFEVGYDLPFMTVALGTNTLNPMLAPNSKYYPPFFNRYTRIYLDFTFYPQIIVDKIKGNRKADQENFTY